ncbi:putative mediator of RNA polymerase II transcription subunit 12 [Hyalella azteca]|uniref:Mediator of RNA polymerase II transcription subunit 12 n=1 Tax=Hyalella azteca TaxID=294128 RepID=A0A979FTH9_HYAAZ|nr:putative mediator of RNA polymerase II transcription subunit 12 [Hyalella azteca]
MQQDCQQRICQTCCQQILFRRAAEAASASAHCQHLLRSTALTLCPTKDNSPSGAADDPSGAADAPSGAADALSDAPSDAHAPDTADADMADEFITGVSGSIIRLSETERHDPAVIAKFNVLRWVLTQRQLALLQRAEEEEEASGEPSSSRHRHHDGGSRDEESEERTITNEQQRPAPVEQEGWQEHQQRLAHIAALQQELWMKRTTLRDLMSGIDKSCPPHLDNLNHHHNHSAPGNDEDEGSQDLRSSSFSASHNATAARHCATESDGHFADGHDADGTALSVRPKAAKHNSLPPVAAAESTAAVDNSDAQQALVDALQQLRAVQGTIDSLHLSLTSGSNKQQLLQQSQQQQQQLLQQSQEQQQLQQQLLQQQQSQQPQLQQLAQPSNQPSQQQQIQQLQQQQQNPLQQLPCSVANTASLHPIDVASSAGLLSLGSSSAAALQQCFSQLYQHAIEIQTLNKQLQVRHQQQLMQLYHQQLYHQQLYHQQLYHQQLQQQHLQHMTHRNLYAETPAYSLYPHSTASIYPHSTASTYPYSSYAALLASTNPAYGFHTSLTPALPLLYPTHSLSVPISFPSGLAPSLPSAGSLPSAHSLSPAGTLPSANSLPPALSLPPPPPLFPPLSSTSSSLLDGAGFAVYGGLASHPPSSTASSYASHMNPPTLPPH